ncbi:MAG TPA: AAA family ATPase, partial [Chloroflexota bacterium]
MASNGYVPPFGAVLKYYRLDLQLTQEELAEQAGVSRLTISALERGVRRAPHRDTVRRLSDAMRLPARDRERLETSARRVDHGAWATALNDAPSRDIPASPPLAGRRHEIDAVERHVEGRGAPLLVLAGEPGIGKTRLLQEAASHARLYGVRVLAAGSERQRLQEPYTPIVGALGHHFLGLDPASRRAALARRPWLTRLLPEHTGDLSAELPVLPAHEERRLMFEAVVGYLTSPDAEGGGGTFGTLLMLDDLQWAGPDALELMDRLVRHAFMPGRVPLWLLGAYRDTEVAPGDPLARMLGDLLPSRLATQLPIGPLDQKESQQLLELLLAGTESQRAD